MGIEQWQRCGSPEHQKGLHVEERGEEWEDTVFKKLTNKEKTKKCCLRLVPANFNPFYSLTMRSGERIARFRASLEQEKNREQKGSELEKAKPNPSASSDQQAGGEAPAREKALQKFKKGKGAGLPFIVSLTLEILTGKPTENGSTGTEPTRQRQDLPTESAPARLTVNPVSDDVSLRLYRYLPCSACSIRARDRK